ncbi:MAG: rod shape-determining protein MreC [Acidobacteriota bacterium]|nr:rod shape-determining protein MreC [Acidobacteriota bacterium]
METFFGRYRNLIVLAAILFAQVIGLAIQVRRPTQLGETRLIRLWAISAVTPLEKAAVHTQTWFQDIWKNYAYLRSVRRENRELKAELDRMKIEQARLGEDARMAQRVQALLAFKEQYVDTTVAAQVIGTSGSEQSRVLYLDKGSNDGIKTDMAVITPTGIVGKIVQVFPQASQVLPLNDQFSGVGVTLKDSRLQGILKGSQNGATTIQYIMADEKVTPGEEVLTSGGDRIFPKGLPVGRVVSVEPGKDLFLNIRVIPAARLDQLEEVLVVTDIKEKMPDAKDLAPIRASDILADRLPTVPNKPATDATGTAKPGTASARTTAASATKPGGAATATTGNKPTTGTAGATAPKPGAASATRATGTTGAPSNNAAAGPTTQPKPKKPAITAPTDNTTGSQPAAGTAANPARNRTSPAVEQSPSKPNQSPATQTPPQL